MNRVFRAWRASFVRRWHSHPDLCDTTDYVAGHQGRCVVLLLALHPDASRELIARVATHDQGEIAFADVAGPAKQRNPYLAASVEELEREEIDAQGFGGKPGAVHDLLDVNDFLLVKLVDRLDTWLWMIRHAPRLSERPDWVALRQRIRDDAGTLRLGEEVDAVIDEALGR